MGCTCVCETEYTLSLTLRAESYLERLIQLQRPCDRTPPLSQSPVALQVRGHGCPLPLPPRPAAREEEWSRSLRDHHPSGYSS